MGRSQVQAVESLLLVGLTHLLLIHGTRRPEPVAHRGGEAIAALARAARQVSPSMVQRLDMADLWDTAARVAARKLSEDGGPARPFAASCPFTAADLLARQPDLDALSARIAAAGPLA